MFIETSKIEYSNRLDNKITQSYHHTQLNFEEDLFMKNKFDCEILKGNLFDIIDVIFLAREDELAELTPADKEKMKEIKRGIDLKYVEYKKALDNVPDGFTVTRRNIIDKFNEYIDELVCREAYMNEKYYKNLTHLTIKYCG